MPSRKDLLARRFGLVMSPAPDEIRRWEEQADELVKAGRTLDSACELAAPIAFRTCGLGPQDRSVSVRRLYGLDDRGVPSPL